MHIIDDAAEHQLSLPSSLSATVRACDCACCMAGIARGAGTGVVGGGAASIEQHPAVVGHLRVGRRGIVMSAIVWQVVETTERTARAALCAARRQALI